MTTTLDPKVVRGLTRTIFANALDRIAARDAEYAEDCALDAANGHRPHYCKHGADLWVDYDVICGPCEDGDPRLLDLWRDCAWHARRFNTDVADLMSAFVTMSKYTDDKGPLVDIVNAGIGSLSARYGLLGAGVAA